MAETPNAKGFADAVAYVVPAINSLEETVPNDVHYWKLFYAIYWIATPIHILIGLIDALFFKKSLYENSMADKTENHIFYMLVAIGLAIFCMFVPASNPKNTVAVFVNLTSTLVPVLLLSWIVITFFFYAIGRQIGDSIIRYRYTNK